MSYTEKDVQRLRGHFGDQHGNPVEAPSEDASFPICAGPWPSPHPVAVCVQCACCSSRVSISPAGYLLHVAHPDRRPVFCMECFIAVEACIEALEKEPN
jgi:hypothetical protein